jgi:hypothetical protein
MHVKYSSRLTKLFVGMALFFLLTLFGLTMTDYLSRGLNTYPGGAGGAGYAAPVDQSTIPPPEGADAPTEGAAEAEAEAAH